MIAGMRIGINFDDTLTDTNYSMIDEINKGRKRDDQIDFSEFDDSGCVSIWRYSELTLRERVLRHVHGGNLLNVIDVVPLAVDCIQDVIDAGVEVHILTSRTDDEKSDIIRFLKRHRIRVSDECVHTNLSNSEKIKLCSEKGLDLYIEDNPNVISMGIRSGVMMVVRDQVYNRNYKNVLRMECFSQLGETCERALLKHARQQKRLDDLVKEEKLANVKEMGDLNTLVVSVKTDVLESVELRMVD